MALVGALAAVGLGQLDPLALDLVDGADMDAVGADDFHMLANFAGVGHGGSPLRLPTITNDGADWMHRLSRQHDVLTAS